MNKPLGIKVNDHNNLAPRVSSVTFAVAPSPYSCSSILIESHFAVLRELFHKLLWVMLSLPSPGDPVINFWQQSLPLGGLQLLSLLSALCLLSQHHTLFLKNILLSASSH